MATEAKDARVEFEVLLSCMHQENFDIAYKSKIDSDLLIINQCDCEGYDEIEVNGHTWRMISTKERGLSKSRNMALANARGEICLLADDDELFEYEYAKTILDAYALRPNADVIVFDINRTGKTRRAQYYHPAAFRRAPRGRGFSSVCLSFRKKRIDENRIRFNESFGSGSSWGGGEDTFFVKSIRDSRLVMYENPSIIATVDYGESQWFSGYDERYYFNCGAFWQEYYGCNFFMREARFAVYSAIKNSKSKLNSYEKWRMFHIGARCFRKGITYLEWKNENTSSDK